MDLVVVLIFSVIYEWIGPCTRSELLASDPLANDELGRWVLSYLLNDRD